MGLRPRIRARTDGNCPRATLVPIATLVVRSTHSRHIWLAHSTESIWWWNFIRLLEINRTPKWWGLTPRDWIKLALWQSAGDFTVPSHPCRVVSQHLCLEASMGVRLS